MASKSGIKLFPGLCVNKDESRFWEASAETVVNACTKCPRPSYSGYVPSSNNGDDGVDLTLGSFERTATNEVLIKSSERR